MKRVAAIVLGLTLAAGFAGARSEEAPPAPVAMDATPGCAALREQEFIQWEEQ